MKECNSMCLKAEALSGHSTLTTCSNYFNRLFRKLHLDWKSRQSPLAIFPTIKVFLFQYSCMKNHTYTYIRAQPSSQAESMLFLLVLCMSINGDEY